MSLANERRPLRQRKPQPLVADGRSAAARHRDSRGNGLARESATILKALWTFLSDSENDPTPGPRIFPIYTIFGMMAFIYWSRTNLVQSDEATWLVHPDEVFQGIEVAHSEVYGYGFRPYEFLPPSWASATVARNGSQADVQRAELGMFAMRSWLHPRIYATVFRWREALGWKLPPYHLARRFHASIAAILPFVIYKLAHMLFGGCRDAAVLSATLVAFSKPLVLLGTRPFLQSLLAPFVFLSVAGLTSTFRNGRSEIDSSVGRVVTFCSSLVLGVAIYIRVDSFVVVSLSIFVFSIRRDALRHVIEFLPLATCGFALGIVVGGWDDYVSYGSWFISPRQWLRFQLKYASLLFGSMSHWFYVTRVPFTSHVDYFAIPAALLLATHFVMTMTLRGRSFLSASWTVYLSRYHHDTLQGLTRASCVALFSFVLYSLHEHKEVRFVHDAVVVLLIASGGALYVAFHTMYELAPLMSTPAVATRRVMKLIIYGEMLLYAFDARLNLPSMREKTNLPWIYGGLWDSGHVNLCLAYVSAQHDVTGVFVDYSVHMTGGYSLLHKNVPLIAKTHFEFREWDVASRRSFPSIGSFGTGPGVSVSTLDDVADFISIYNAPFVMKKLAEATEYNYVVITSGRKFPRRGFRRVYNSSDAVVYKRVHGRKEMEALANAASKIPIGSNATVLEYEGSWLLTLGVFDKAVVRLREALRIDSGSIRAWQLLAIASEQGGATDEAHKVLTECYRLHGREKCSSITQKVILHSQYDVKLSRGLG